jgi:hypothetical protein
MPTTMSRIRVRLAVTISERPRLRTCLLVGLGPWRLPFQRARRLGPSPQQS